MKQARKKGAKMIQEQMTNRRKKKVDKFIPNHINSHDYKQYQKPKINNTWILSENRTRCNCMFLTRSLLKYKEKNRLKVKSWKNLHGANINQ